MNILAKTPYFFPTSIWRYTYFFLFYRQRKMIKVKKNPISLGVKLLSAQNFECLDRRFLLTKNHQVQFQGLSKEHSMPLEKLAASLSLPRTALFSYLKIANRKKRTLISYSKSERIIIKQFVRLSNYKKSYIPCTAMRNVCR